MTSFSGSSYGIDLRLRAKKLNLKFPKSVIMADVKSAQLEASLALKPSVETFLKKNFGTQYYSLNQLAKMGHPYARNFRAGKTGRLSKPDWVINTQSGEFYQSLDVDINADTGDSSGAKYARIVIDSNDPKAAVLSVGTSSMRPRPWRQAIQAIFYSEFTNRLSNDFRKIIRIKATNSGYELIISRGGKVL